MLKRILQYSAFFAAGALGIHVLSRARRQLSLARHHDVRITHARIGRITWTGDLDLSVGIALSNPTKGSLPISQPVVQVFQCAGETCDNLVASSDATGRQYTLAPEKTIQLDDILLRVNLRSQLASLASITSLIQKWTTTRKAGLSYKLVVKTNVQGLGIGLGLITTERRLEV